MDETLLQLGVGGIFAVLVLREVFSYLRTRKGGGPDGEGCITPDDRRKLNDLHQWHARTDADGVPVWHVRQDLRDAILELTKASNRMDLSLERQTEILERQTKLLEDIQRNTNHPNRRLSSVRVPRPDLDNHK